MIAALESLLSSDDPCVRYRALVDGCGLSPTEPQAHQAQEAIRSSSRVAALLSYRNANGQIPGHVYAKFTGAHWVLADLADIGYPPGDPSLIPIRDQVYACWLSPAHTQENIVKGGPARYRYSGVPIIAGRARRCASQEGNALYATIALGLADERADQLAANLIRWQWPDGGWNCDKKPAAQTSSFHESLLPLRGLVWHARLTGAPESRRAVEASAESFLKRKLFRRQSDGSVIRDSFLKLHYPHYWHYDILIALKVMVEAGFITDPRCAEALDVLESKRLPNGGWRAEGKHYRIVAEPANGGSLTGWGSVSQRQMMNPFVTLDALYVLRAAGRLRFDKENEVEHKRTFRTLG